jgi:hypothetical protein
MADLRAENARLQAIISDLRRPRPESPRSVEHDSFRERFERLKWLQDAVAARRVVLSLNLFQSDGALSADMVDLFGIAPADVAALNAITTEVKRDLTQLALRHAAVSRNAQSNYVVHVPSFIAEGQPMYDRLTQAFQARLGPAKGPVFAALVGDRIESAFEMFGAQERNLTLYWDAPQNGGPGLLKLDDQRKQGVASSVSTSQFLTFSDLQKYSPSKELLDLFPPEARSH